MLERHHKRVCVVYLVPLCASGQEKSVALAMGLGSGRGDLVPGWLTNSSQIECHCHRIIKRKVSAALVVPNLSWTRNNNMHVAHVDISQTRRGLRTGALGVYKQQVPHKQPNLHPFKPLTNMSKSAHNECSRPWNKGSRKIKTSPTNWIAMCQGRVQSWRKWIHVNWNVKWEKAQFWFKLLQPFENGREVFKN